MKNMLHVCIYCLIKNIRTVYLFLISFSLNNYNVSKLLIEIKNYFKRIIILWNNRTTKYLFACNLNFL